MDTFDKMFFSLYVKTNLKTLFEVNDAVQEKNNVHGFLGL